MRDKQFGDLELDDYVIFGFGWGLTVEGAVYWLMVTDRMRDELRKVKKDDQERK